MQGYREEARVSEVEQAWNNGRNNGKREKGKGEGQAYWLGLPGRWDVVTD